MVATTLAGYTPYTHRDDGPDLDLVERLAARLSMPVVAEGRIGTPAQARQAIERGAWAVVVGTAITDPGAIAALFAAEVAAARIPAPAERRESTA
jgi:N-acylglucosamine-6-phosphate 2-epimerase